MGRRRHSQSRDNRSWSDTRQTIRYIKREYRMPFGKYREQPLKEVPTDYLLWLMREEILDNPRLEEEVEKVLGTRRDSTEALLWMMDREIPDDEFAKIADELDRRKDVAGWGQPDHSRAG